MATPEIKVGTVVYKRKKKPNGVYSGEIQEGVVTKIGRKYFYAEFKPHDWAIDKSTMLYENKEYSQNNFKVYLSKEEVAEEDTMSYIKRYISIQIRENALQYMPKEEIMTIYEIISKYQ